MEKWFAKRRKSKVLELADRQMTLAIETVIDLQKTIQSGLKGDKKNAKEHIHEQVGREDDRLLFNVQGNLLSWIGDAEIVQCDDEDDDSDQVADCHV